jgi:dolichol-phosphate mannosyltransferase
MLENIVHSIIVPLYNEEEVIEELYKRLKRVMDSCEEPYEVIFVDDGSKDKTYEKVKVICNEDNSFKLVKFSRNFGHQAAITAGMNTSVGKAVIVIDADLQDPPEIILKMIEKWKEGYEVVYGKRVKRNGESLFKKLSAKMFYRTLNSLTSVKIPVDTGDFRLIDRKVCDELNALPERNRYIRGLVSWLGFKQTAVEFVREGRFAGETKYPLKKMLKFAADAITAFSYKPLKLASYFGTLISILSFVYLIVVIYQKLFTDLTVSGWASIIACSIFFNGIILIMLGIIGEYIGRIYEEAKGRPLYIVRETIGIKEK